MVAESTGKVGKGLIPIDREALAKPDVCAADRMFVYLSLSTAPEGAQDAAVHELEGAGYPVVRIAVDDPYDLGEEFFRWEFATAVIGSILGIHPSLAGYLGAHLNRLNEGDYFALLAFIEMNEVHERVLQEIREGVRDVKRVATCLEFGPRFLHSTGQASKGGPNTGVFLQILAEALMTRCVRGPREGGAGLTILISAG